MKKKDKKEKEKKLLIVCPQCGLKLVPSLVTSTWAWCDNCCCKITKG